MCPKFYEKSIQEAKKTIGLSLICKIDPQNPKFDEGENMEIFGLYGPEPVTDLRPKMLRNNMIRASVGSETPAQPSRGVTSASERVPVEQQHWRCDICKGN
jgi:hypothetical protein